MLKKIVERGRPQMTIWRMRIACWIAEATNTRSEYVIMIACPLQQRLHGRASVLRYVIRYTLYVRTVAGLFNCSVRQIQSECFCIHCVWFALVHRFEGGA